MKSKTSCFNSTIFKRNFLQYWPLFLAYLCYMLAILPVNLWLSCQQIYLDSSVSQTVAQYWIMGDVLDAALLPLPIFIFAVMTAMAFFNYLYSARSANMIHALPVNRLELFATNCVSGLGFLIIPELVAFVAAVLVGLANQITYIEFLFWWLLNVMGITLFAFGAAVFAAMLTGHILALPVYYFVANYLYVGCFYLVNQLIAAIGYGISDVWNPGSSCILSPIYYIGNNVRIVRDYDSAYNLNGLEFVGYKLVIVYVVAGVALFAAAYQIYARRSIETAGDFISVAVLEPIFRCGVAVCGGLALALGIRELIEQYIEVDSFVCILSLLVIFGSICFFAAEMLIEKNLRIRKKKCLPEWAVCMAAAVFFLVLVKLDAFGVERDVPLAEEVEQAFIYMDYPIAADEAQTIIDIHEQLISMKDEYSSLSWKDGNNTSVTLRYYMKDGTVFERRYYVPLTQDALGDENSPTSIIRSLESQEEYVKQRLLSFYGGGNSCYAAFVERFDENGMESSYVLQQDEAEALIDAIEKDIKAGNFNDYLFYEPEQEKIYYWNSIGFEYTVVGYYNDAWDYYQNYREIKNRDSLTYTVGGSSYLSYGPKCQYTVEALYDLGIFDEQWKLYTVEEYEKLMNY